MNKNSKFSLLVCLTLGGCVADASPDPDEQGTNAMEQAVAGQTHYDARDFGGNIFAEHHYYVMGEDCSPDHMRSSATTHWQAQVGGYCSFNGWNSPDNPLDCRAKIDAYTSGGWFGGRCESWVFEQDVPKTFTFDRTNTASATTNTENRTIALGAGETLTIGTCGVTNSVFNGDTYLRLFIPATPPKLVQVAENDDACSIGSNIVYTSPSKGNVEIHAGCYSADSCSGTVAWTIQ